MESKGIFQAAAHHDSSRKLYRKHLDEAAESTRIRHGEHTPLPGRDRRSKERRREALLARYDAIAERLLPFLEETDRELAFETGYVLVDNPGVEDAPPQMALYLSAGVIPKTGRVFYVHAVWRHLTDDSFRHLEGVSRSMFNTESPTPRAMKSLTMVEASLNEFVTALGEA